MAGGKVDPPAEFHGIGADIPAQDLNLSFLGRQEVGEDGEEGGLARAVRAQDAPEGPGGDGKVHPL